MELLFMGQVSADDFEWGTKAGLAGGTTMIVDHCIPAPGASMVEAVKAWHEKAAKAAGDFSYHVAVTAWTDRTAEEMGTVVNEMGVNTFKHFMAYKGALMVDDDIMFKSFSRCAQLGATALVHAENGDLVLQLQNLYMGQGKSGPEFHAYSRPPEVEGEATNRAIMIADMAGCPVYIVHTSCIQAHEAIARARAQGKRVFGEPLIQHLVLDETDYLNRDWDHSAQRVTPGRRSARRAGSRWGCRCRTRRSAAAAAAARRGGPAPPRASRACGPAAVTRVLEAARARAAPRR
jgi:dihydropyrimidinase